ncbi:carboxylesterase [Rhizobium vallis]|uniref:Carboxylesterase n=1 Tax=Rhizobium vallis TaxID=634290 RepID=A0A3S0RB42_9HYPH|nr:alpha/beta fold hydrolase [Rhizobium vallis]RUM25843.1 carboxylesterase [Rhizobium vallis]
MSGDKLSFFEPGTSGKAVLLVHGLTGAPAEMRLVARRFHRRGYSVYAPLLAGHGDTATTLRRSCWQDWLETVETAAEWLARRNDAVFAAGICVGGKLCLMAAANAPMHVDAVALYSPCFHYDGWQVPRYQSLLSQHLSWLSPIPLLGRLSFKETPSLGIKDTRMRRMIAGLSREGILDAFPAKALFEMHRLGETVKARLAKISTPTLIVHSRQDDLSGPSHARFIADHIGSRHHLHWLDDSYHMIHVDRQHREVADVSAAFFEAEYALS